MTTNWTVWLSIAFVFMTGSGLIWLVSRMNSQIRRYQEAPTPKESFKVLADIQNAEMMTVSGLEIKVGRLETEMQDLHALFRKHQSRDAAQQRRNNEIDIKDLERYVQKVVDEPQEKDEDQEELFDNIDDFR